MQTVRGMKDWFGEDAWKREYVIGKIKSVFQRYGHEPFEAPAVEYFETLAVKGGGGDAVKDEIYYFKDKSDRELGLRFDMTVPAARFVASNPTLPKPFKRYIIGKVWRYDRPQAGRYREFTQADVDIFGSNSIQSDVEIVSVAVDVMKTLGFKGFKIRVNNRKVLEAIALSAGIPENKVPDAFRAMDKLDKIGWDGVKEELLSRDVPNYEKLIEIVKNNNLEVVRDELGRYDVGKTGLSEIDELLRYAEDIGFRDELKLDLTLVRGLEYYTGNVFEIQAGGQWACGGGGRYDKLIEIYGGRPTPAIGISFGVERLIQLMEEAKFFPNNYKPDTIYIAPIGNIAYAWEIRKKLMEIGIPTDMDIMGRKLGKQFDYIKTRGYRWIVVVGENEEKTGEITIKNTETREETKLKVEDLSKIKEIIN